VSIGRTMDCCCWQKSTYSNKVTINSEEIKPVAIAIIESYLSDGLVSSGSSKS